MRFITLITLLCSMSAAAQVSLGGLPLSFEENHGQADAEVRYLARCPGFTLFVTGETAVMAAPAGILRLRFLGALEAPAVCGKWPLPGVSRYYRSCNPDQWVQGAPTYARVEVAEVYPGIDLVYYGTHDGQLEFDLVVAPGADPGQIEFEIEGAQEAEIDGGGNLLFRLGDREAVLEAPEVYQGPSRIGSRFQLQADEQCPGAFRVSFEIEDYDSERTLVIDPVLASSSFFGGGGTGTGDTVDDIGTDSAGNVYLAGYTASSDFPTVNPVQGTYGGGSWDVFVAKVDPVGPTLLYSTFLGGSGTEQATDIAVDGVGNAHVTGYTRSANFPTLNPIQGTHGGGNDDAFLAKLDPVGALVYSTYHGGSSGEWGTDVVLDSAGSAYVGGWTNSADLPTTVGALQEVISGPGDAFVTKFNAGGSAFVFSTLLGGDSYDSIQGMDVDSAGNIYLAGSTSSADFPTVNPVQSMRSGSGDAFVAKLAASGASLVFSTFLGGTSTEDAWGVAVDSLGYVAVAGGTRSTDFPTLNAIQPTFGGDSKDGFVARLDPSGGSFVFSTYLGGTGYEEVLDADLDGAGNIYVGGYTNSVDWPMAFPVQGTIAGRRDCMLTSLDPTGQTILFSTFVGGTNDDIGYGIHVDTSSRAYIVGHTNSWDWPQVNPVQPVYGGGNRDGLFCRFDPEVNILTITPAQSSVLLGETGAPVAIDVENRGTNDVQIVSADLTFADSLGVDLGGDYWVMPAPGNPTIIAAGFTETLNFTVDVAVAASLGAVTIDAAVTAVDLVTTAPLGDTGAAATGSWTVEMGEALLRTVDATAMEAVLGSTGNAVSVTVENTGINAIDVMAVTLSFMGSADRTPEYAVTPSPGNPTTIAGGATELFSFLVDVSLSATPELVTIDGEFSGIETATLAPVIDAGADVTDSWTVIACILAVCGDCNGDSVVTILDSLAGAQHGVGLVTLVGSDFSSCNVTGALEPDPAAIVNVLDALALAQAAAGIPVALFCC